MAYGLFRSELPSKGYDVTSPFMSGLKENIGNIVPLAMQATQLKMAEEKSNAILGMEREKLTNAIEETKRKNLENSLKTLLPVAAEAKSQDMMGQVAERFKQITGVDWPTKTAAPDITSPGNFQMIDKGLPLPAGKTEYFIPSTDAEKKMELQKIIGDLRLSNTEAINDVKLKIALGAQETSANNALLRYLATMAGVNQKADSAKKKVDSKTERDITSYYNQLFRERAKGLLDPLTGAALPGKEEEVRNLADAFEIDKQYDIWASGEGQKPRYKAGQPRIGNAVMFLKRATDRNDAIKKIQELDKQKWSREDLAEIVRLSGWD